MTRETLTEAQAEVLRDLTNDRRYADGWAAANWIAESCGHAYDTPWASSRLRSLVGKGHVEKNGLGHYRITPAGRQALADREAQDHG